MKTNLIEDEIVSIEYIGDTETVDICVSGDNLFIANSILTHNSGYEANEPGLNTISESIGLAATADVICSIYRPDPENQENTISFGMMKNRFGVNSGSRAMLIDYNTLTITEDETANNTESGQSSVNLLRTLDMDS
jgi:hypothetical protein